MTIETLSQLEAYRCSDEKRWVSLNYARLYLDIRKELAKAELRGEQAAEQRALELAQVAGTVQADAPQKDDGLRTDGAFGDYVVTRRQLGDILSRLREEFEGKVYETRSSIKNVEHAVRRWEHGDGAKAIEVLDHAMAGVCARVSDLERNLGPDLKNEVAQAQIAKYQGLGKRISEAETRLERQGEALNDHLGRLGKLEAHPERLGSSEKRLDQRVDAMSMRLDGHWAAIDAHDARMDAMDERVGALKAWRSNVVRLEHVGALDERVSALEAAAVQPGPPEHRDLVALDKHFDGRVDRLSKRVDALEHGLQNHTHAQRFGTVEQVVVIPKMWGNTQAPDATWVGGKPPTAQQIAEANSRGK